MSVRTFSSQYFLKFHTYPSFAIRREIHVYFSIDVSSTHRRLFLGVSHSPFSILSAFQPPTTFSVQRVHTSKYGLTATRENSALETNEETPNHRESDVNAEIGRGEVNFDYQPALGNESRRFPRAYWTYLLQHALQSR